MFYKKDRFNHTALRAALIGVLATLAGAAQAADGDKMFSIGGFGTAGAAHSSIKSGDYVADLFQPNGPGYTQDWSTTLDSKLAVQLNARFSDQLTAVVQVIAMERTNNTFSPRIEWANLKYALTPDLSVRLGRIALPGFMMSESRMVGFSNPWIRPPVENYSLLSITNSDGVDLSYRRSFGAVNNTVQTWLGQTKIDSVGSSGSISRGIKAPKIYGLADTVEYGAWTARAGINYANLEIGSTPASRLKPRSIVANLGLMYDPGAWFVQAELSHRTLGTVQRAQRSFYATAGYRWNAFTPYASFAQVKPDDNQIKLAPRDQHTTTLGLRWDVRKNVDLKIQLDRISLGQGSNGFFTNVKPGLAGSSGNIASVAVDFIY